MPVVDVETDTLTPLRNNCVLQFKKNLLIHRDVRGGYELELSRLLQAVELLDLDFEARGLLP